MAFPDALLGALAGELLNLVKDLGERSIMFRPVLYDIKSTLSEIAPLLKQIEDSNRRLDFPPEETEKLKKIVKNGTKLITKCGKVRWWKYNTILTPWYTTELRDLETSLKNYLQTIMQLQQTRTGLLTLETVRRIESCSSSNSSWLSVRRGLVEPCAVPDLREEAFGFDGFVEKVKREFLRSGVSKLLITGPGGCGKTTLATMFCIDEDVKSMFGDNIFFITFSKKPDLKLIVQDVLVHKGFEVPALQDDVTAIRRLEQFLRQISLTPVLFVIDDAWSVSVLDKFAFNISNYKLLVTSRNKLPGFDHPFYLESLSDEDAIKVFRRAAIMEDGASYYRPDDDLVKKIVQDLKRFPLALRVVGRSLRGKREAVWKDAERKWSRLPYILDSDEELLNCLQSSLDVLNDRAEIKDSFLDLSSFPEDQIIPVSVFIDVCASLYGLDENVAITMLDELFDRNLVDSIVIRKDACKDEFYNEQFLKQHDVLRELAIHLCCSGLIEERKRLIMDITGNDLPKWWSEEKKNPLSARLLSIHTDKMFSLCWSTLQAPEVRVLILNLQTENYNFPDFMKGMEKLKSLIVTNYGFFPTELSNYQLLSSLSSLKTITFERISIPSLSDNSLRLVNLQKISFYMCKITLDFKNCSMQELFPNLLELSIDFCNDLLELPEGVGDLSLLKTLNITNCHRLSFLPEGMGQLVNLKHLRLRSCTEILELPESVKSLENLNFLDISYCHSIMKLPGGIGEMRNLRKLKMNSCSSLQKLPKSVNLLRNLKVICDREISQQWRVFAPEVTVEKWEETPTLDWLKF